MTKINWLPEHDEALEIWMGDENNLSFEFISVQMAKKFGLPFSRNGCIGRAHRLKLPPRPPRAIMQAASMHSNLLKFKPRVDAPIVPKEAIHRPGNRQLTLLQLGYGDCRYPSNEEKPPYTYCGLPTKDGASFCPACRKICYSEQRERRS